MPCNLSSCRVELLGQQGPRVSILTKMELSQIQHTDHSMQRMRVVLFGVACPTSEILSAEYALRLTGVMQSDAAFSSVFTDTNDTEMETKYEVLSKRMMTIWTNFARSG